MTSLALALALASQPAPTTLAPWRVVATDRCHVGVRPAAHVTSESDERAAGITVQITGCVAPLF